MSAETTPAHLTLNGIFNVKDSVQQKLQSSKDLTLQVILVKLFTSDEVKNKIKGKLTLSDGATSIRTLITESLYNKMVCVLLRI